MFIANHYITPQEVGYSLRKQNGTINTKKFINTFDYSLDLIKLREVAEKELGKKQFSFIYKDGFEYCPHLINVTFKYSTKLYNEVAKNIYVKFGYNLRDLKFINNTCVIDNQLIAIILDKSIADPISKVVPQPITQEILGKHFCYSDLDNSYHLKGTIETLKTRMELREELYQNGFYCEGIHFVRFKRSSGSARVGKCLFINEALYPKMHKWDMCGIKVKEGQPVDLAALESYIALSSSSIIDTLEIKPENILIIDDYNSEFTDTVLATKDVGSSLITEKAEVKISNCIWDGESLIDQSAMGDYADYGMVLLRNRLFKSCCFNTNLQKWLLDNRITDIKQLNGFTLAKSIEDIKLVTTPSSIKYLKFGTLEEWLSQLSPTFGIVKHDKKTHYFGGALVQTHYQLLNTLQLSLKDMEDFLSPSMEFKRMLRDDPAVLKYFIKYPTDYQFGQYPITDRNDIVFNLLSINNRFSQTKLYHDFRTTLIKSYIRNLKCGHIFVNGNYSTLFGNPYEMLQSTIGQFNGSSLLPVGAIHSKRFEYNQTILGSRSPHVCASNVWLPYNVESSEIDRYFNLTPEIVCINSIGDNVLQRLNGADFDSDTVLLTDNPILIKAAKKNYDKFLVPTNFVSNTKVKRTYTAAQQADLDMKASVNKIGEIINLSQILNTVYWDNLFSGMSFQDNEELYADICTLAVLSNVEIDRAKKEFSFASQDILDNLKAKYTPILTDTEKNRGIKPHFFKEVLKSKGKTDFYDFDRPGNKRGERITGTKSYRKFHTSMDYLNTVINQRKYYRPSDASKKLLPFSSILDKAKYKRNCINTPAVERVCGYMYELKADIKELYKRDGVDMDTKYFLYSRLIKKYSLMIEAQKMNYSTMYKLLTCLEEESHKTIRLMLFDILFLSHNNSFFDVIMQSKEPVESIIEDPEGDLKIFNISFKRGQDISTYIE